MAEQWFIKVEGKEYGPADLATLLEWKGEGRVLRTNEARHSDAQDWTVAGEIPGLFETVPPPQTVPPPMQIEPGVKRGPQRSLREIFGQTLSIYRRGFFRFLGLTLLVIGPSICAQLTQSVIVSGSETDVDLAKLAAGGFAFCMTLMTLALWPIYIAGVQILSAELSHGNRAGFLAVLNAAFRYWARVAGLSIVVYGVFFLLTAFGLGIALMIQTGAGSLPMVLLSLVLLTLQVWLFGRWFINTLFWQQTAVLENAEPIEALRLSKEMARSGQELPWYRRPMWRGAFVASIWVAFALALEIAAAWPALQQSFQTVMSAHDPQAVMDAMKAAQNARGFDAEAVALTVFQAILRPLLGIAFVLIYFDGKGEPAP